MGDIFPIIKKGSVYSIGYDYISYCYGNKITEVQKDKLLQMFSELLNTWCIEDIYVELNNIVDTTNEKDFTNMNYIKKHFNSIKPPKRNLIPSDIPRTHSELQLIAPVTEIITDPICFEVIESITSEYYLEQQASYSMNDLFQYVMKEKKYILLEANNEQKIYNVLEYFLKTIDIKGVLNVVLFAFDEAIRNCKRKQCKISNFYNIQNYLEQSIEKHNRLLNRQIYGDIKFVPKKRVLFDKSGLEIRKTSIKKNRKKSNE